MTMLRNLQRDRTGATALEFGIVCIPFLMTFLFIVNIGMQLFTQATMDAAVAAAARQIKIGNQRGTSDAGVRSMMCAQIAADPTNCAAIQIYVTSGASFGTLLPAAVVNGNLNKTGFAPGVLGNFVLMQVAYPTLTPFPLAPVAPTFMSSAVFRNEP